MTTFGKTIRMLEGESRLVTIKVVDQDGTPYDLSAADSVQWVVTSGPTSESDLLAKNSGVDLSFVDVDGTNDGAQFKITSADSADLGAGTHHHELRVNEDADDSFVGVTGALEIGASASG